MYLLIKRHKHQRAWFVANHSSDMTLAGYILCQDYVTEPELAFGAITNFKLNAARQNYKILTSRGRMPISNPPYLPAIEHDPCGALQGREHPSRIVTYFLELHSFKMGLVVGTGENALDLQSFLLSRSQIELARLLLSFRISSYVGSSGTLPKAGGISKPFRTQASNE